VLPTPSHTVSGRLVSIFVMAGQRPSSIQVAAGPSSTMSQW